MYHFLVRVTTIDFDRSLIPDAKQPEYDWWLSIGAVNNQQVSLDGDGSKKPIPVQIISYYDELKDFSFDPSTKEMQFTMPFDWNVTRLETNKIMVHQEVNLPKPSELSAESYVGLMIDPTNSTKDVVRFMIVHFMIPKPVVMQIAQQITKNGQAGEGLMKFTLKPTV